MEIRFEGVQKIYPGQVKALDGIDLTIPVGMYGLLGPNGAGKTTLMRILCTLMEPTAGKITVDGIDRLVEPERVRRILGYLPQEFGLYRRLTAPEYLDFVGSMKGLSGAERRRQVADVLERVNLTHERRKPLGGYSGGMKRRLGIAQALLGDPKILVVDEPTAGLDPEERLRFRNLLADLSTSRIVLLSTHIASDIEATCQSVAVMQKGRVRFTGSPTALMQAAAGQVWQLDLPAAEYERVRSTLKVVSARRTSDAVSLRVLAPERPLGIGESLPPTLEDGYLCLTGEGAA
ncbi:MAG TPA: ABC transporter ATP-binding protein [Symbiobacteriaceae bacterium]|nr:ABC transporter ATP-binding protein [Symbiobacteriaceae bacterium]